MSVVTLLADYLRRDEEKLAVFRKNAEEDLRFRQLLLTALMFLKKDVQLKNASISDMNPMEKKQLMKQLHPIFNIDDATHTITTNHFEIEQALPLNSKRCTFQIEEEQMNYVIHFPEDPITKIQASNSSEIGIFMGLVPKYKLLLLQAGEFISMNKVNPEVNIFFYIKHFIKNITEVTKESHPRVFIPEIHEKNYAFFKDLSEEVKSTIFGT